MPASSHGENQQHDPNRLKCSLNLFVDAQGQCSRVPAAQRRGSDPIPYRGDSQVYRCSCGGPEAGVCHLHWYLLLGVQTDAVSTDMLSSLVRVG